MAEIKVEVVGLYIQDGFNSYTPISYIISLSLKFKMRWKYSLEVKNHVHVVCFSGTSPAKQDGGGNYFKIINFFVDDLNFSKKAPAHWYINPPISLHPIPNIIPYVVLYFTLLFLVLCAFSACILHWPQ